MTKQLTIQRLTGKAIETYIPDLARLRIEVFRDYPYLYDGDYDYEAKYLHTYIQAKDSVIVIVLDGTHVVGASTAVPLCHEMEEVKRPFVTQGYNPEEIFYLGESVLQKAYRGQGLGVQFFLEREAHAYLLGGFKYAAFCAVERPANHSRRPADYVSLDEFWGRRGYVKQPELQTTFSWKELGEAHQSPKPMVFWLKRLVGNL